MYYDERKINGVWMWRGTPTGEWHRFTPEGRRWRMRADLLAMAERASWALVQQWSNGQAQALSLQVHYYACRAFAAELKQEAQQ